MEKLIIIMYCVELFAGIAVYFWLKKTIRRLLPTEEKEECLKIYLADLPRKMHDIVRADVVDLLHKHFDRLGLKYDPVDTHRLITVFKTYTPKNWKQELLNKFVVVTPDVQECKPPVVTPEPIWEATCPPKK
jgi:hypothetical protein